MRIRKYKKMDKRECVKIIANSLGETCGRMSKGHFSARTGNRPDDYAFFHRMVAIEGKKVIGICGIYRTNTTPQDFWGIDWFAVDKKYRNRGVGKALFSAVTKGVKGKIFVWATKKAIKFYEKMGLKFLEAESAYFMVSGESSDS